MGGGILLLLALHSMGLGYKWRRMGYGTLSTNLLLS